MSAGEKFNSFGPDADPSIGRVIFRAITGRTVRYSWEARNQLSEVDRADMMIAVVNLALGRTLTADDELYLGQVGAVAEQRLPDGRVKHTTVFGPDMVLHDIEGSNGEAALEA